MLSNIQPFIDLDLYTVPLNGSKIQRDEKGKKYGFSFPSDWQATHQATQNTTATSIGGLLTGVDQVVAIDCDDTVTYNMFRQLDPTYTAVFHSIGKLDKNLEPIESGTILYKWEEDLPASFRMTNSDRDLDYYNGTGLVFLPTEANETKMPWCTIDDVLCNHLEQPVELKTMPSEVKALLHILNAPREEKTDRVADFTSNTGFLAPILENCDYMDYDPLVTKLLTPKDYRNNKYQQQGHLHPNDIQGSGHIYLFKIACILAGDYTVNKDLMIETVEYINELWEDPISNKKLHKTILDPIASGKQTNSKGEPYFSYDPDWENLRGLTNVSKRNHLIEVFYDDIKMRHYFYNTTEDTMSFTTKQSDTTAKCKNLFKGFKPIELDECKIIRTTSAPTENYGHIEDEHFNLFKRSYALEVLQNPEIHETEYKRPTEFIAYMEHFIPSEQQREYFLRLIRTKLTTFNYSPVVPYIVGVQGSGKNTIMTVLGNMIGKQYVKTDVSGSQFLEKYNDWLMDTYFVQLNELSDTVNTKGEKSQAQGILKNYTGSKDFEVRRMGTNYFTYPQTAMFLMTANRNPLTVPDDDRRLYYIGTPNTFDYSPQCVASSPVRVYEAIMNQTVDIAYWLATEFKNLSDLDYMRAPDNDGKARIIFETLPTSGRIGWALKNKEFDILIEDMLMDTPNPYKLFDNADEGRVTLESLMDVYTYIQPDSTDAEKIMKHTMKAHGFTVKFTTGNAIYYEVDGIESIDIGDIHAEEIELEEVRT